MSSTSTTPHVLKMDRWHRYECTAEDHTACKGKVFRSVTTLLNKAVPKDLSWWGMTIGAEATKELYAREYDLAAMSADEIVDAIKAEKLTVRDRMNQRGAEGTALHDALEAYINDGTIPNATDFPTHEQGRVRGLARFITTYDPEFLAAEVQVISVEHEYAGTYDFEANIKGRVERKGKALVFTPDPTANTYTLGDLKSSKWVYPTSHFAQLEAYENGRREMGMRPTEARAVLWIPANGDMRLIPSTFSIEDFLTLRRSAEVVDRGDREGRALRKVATNE